jgi:hypothetical protein
MIPTPDSGTLVEVEGLDETRAITGVTAVDLTMKPGTSVFAPPDGDRYLGFVFARAEKTEDVIEILRRAQKIIRVRVK